MNAREIFAALQRGEIDAGEARRRLLYRPRNDGQHGADGAGARGDLAPAPGSVKLAPDGGVDIAVIGINGRFPMASNIDEFWLNLTKGADCVTEVPGDRWDNDEFYCADKEAVGKTYCKWGGFISDVAEFDPLFFNISPRDAELIDPQERKFLEVVWETLERAGYTRRRITEQLNGEVGVFAGAMYQQYHAFDTDLPKKALVALSSYGSMANRVSYFFNLRGPSVALDTMCSSGSVAVDMACQSLRSGGCKMAIAGAANLSIHPYKYVALSQAQMLSSDKDRRSFADGDGFVPAEVVAAVLLKPLPDAEADGDNILAVIRSSAVRHKGRSEGFAVPEVGAQISLMQDHFARTGIQPDSVSYIESSASGAQAADAAEFAALRHVFPSAGAEFRCALGSVKANIGHAEASAGMAQLAKVVLQLFHRKLVPSIKADPPNPNISFANTPLYLVASLADWERPVRRSDAGAEALPRRACINTFGAGGTNCHIILEEYTAPGDGRQADGSRPFPPVFTFSAHKGRSLLPLVERFRAFFERNQDLSLRDVAYTLQLGREEMQHRVAVTARSAGELIGSLVAAERLLSGDARSPRPDNLFLGVVGPDSADAPGRPAVGDAPSGIQDAGLNLRALAESWVRGGEVRWERYYGDAPARIVPLPPYPFDRRRYWLSGPQATPGRPAGMASASEADSSPAAGDGFETTRRRVTELLEGFLSESLALQPDEAVSRDASFIELGADSVTLTRLARKIEVELSVKVKNRDFHQHRSIASLSDYLTSCLRQEEAGSPTA